jgi:hypothetical protein
MRSSDRTRLPVLAIAVSLAIAASFPVAGCVLDQGLEMQEARAAYQACVDAHPVDARERCAALEAELAARTERYEQDARGAWGCAPSDSGCPRDGTPSAGR